MVDHSLECKYVQKEYKKWTFLLPKSDISDIFTQATSDLIKSAKAGLLRAIALAVTENPSEQMSC